MDWLPGSRLGDMLEPFTRVITQRGRGSLMYENIRLLSLAFAFVRSEKVPGDYTEFGVYNGRTFIEAWRTARRYGGGARRFIAYDSFRGLPDVGGLDDVGRFNTGDFTYSRQAFERRLRRARIPASRIHIVDGFFDDTLARPELIPVEQIAIAWVDCDLYASTVPVLDYLTPRLAQGAILIFDDWYCFQGDPNMGEMRACAEWLDRNPEVTLVPWQQHNWAGQSFIFRRKPE
jgi:O-methyltransferase